MIRGSNCNELLLDFFKLSKFGPQRSACSLSARKTCDRISLRSCDPVRRLHTVLALCEAVLCLAVLFVNFTRAISVQESICHVKL